MRILKDYIYENIEYLVTDGRDGFNPSADGIRMLASRKVGVGADKIIVFHGSAECPSFTVYDADGNKVEASREDVLVFAYYLRCEGIPASAVGDTTIGVSSESCPAAIASITNSAVIIFVVLAGASFSFAFWA